MNLFYLGNGSAVYAADRITSSSDTYSHVAATYNSTDLKIYINGTLSKTNNISNPIPIGTNNYDLFIGSSTGTHSGGTVSAGESYFKGNIDEVLIFNRSLSSGEIQSLYNASQYQYQNNFTGLSNGQHKFTAYSVDVNGNKNQTDERIVNIDPFYPIFYNYTDDNSTLANSGIATFNVSINNTNGTVFLQNKHRQFLQVLILI